MSEVDDVLSGAAKKKQSKLQQTGINRIIPETCDNEFEVDSLSSLSPSVSNSNASASITAAQAVELWKKRDVQLDAKD